MSIADKITQLTNIRAAIRSALVNKGVTAASTHNYEDFASDIAAISGGGGGGITPSGTINITTNGTHDVTSYASANVNVSASPNLQSKTVTPTAAGLTVTPGSNYDGLSSVVVEGDADLVPGNIADGVTIFGVTGTLSSGSIINGSLIEVMCSTDIDAVTAVIGSNTYNGFLDTSTNTAYITIPYTVTSGTATINGYHNGTIVATDTVTISGINKYCAAVYSSSALYNAGTWNIRKPTFVTRSPASGASSLRITDTASNGYLILTSSSGTSAGYSTMRYPMVLPANCTGLKVTVSQKNSTDLYLAVYAGTTVSADYFSDQISMAVGENTFTIPAGLRGKEVYMWLGGIASATKTNRVTKIEIVTS